MTPKKSAASSKSLKRKTKQPVSYLSQPNVGKLIKETSAFARWREKEELKLSGGGFENDFNKAYKLFEADRAKKKSALWELQRDAMKERNDRVLFRRNLDSMQIGERSWNADRFIAHPLFIDHEIAPTKTLIYSGSPAAVAYSIYPCPDLRKWSSWFEDNEVTLNQGYRYWFPSQEPQIIIPSGPPLSFSGFFIISTNFSLQGVVDIGKYGSVTVDIATYLTIVECNAPDRNHDGGWHYDPNYDRIISTWSSYCNCDMIQQRYFTDTQQGLHTFAHCIEQPVSLMCSCGASNRFVEMTHMLTITAINATCQFGPNRTDCLAGSSPGWIKTCWPIIQLEYK